MPVEAALGDPELLAESVDAQRIRPAVGEQRETGLNPVVDRKPASGAARRGHARQHTTTSNVTAVKISSGKEFRPKVLLQPWPPVVTAALRLLHPARPAGGTPRCRTRPRLLQLVNRTILPGMGNVLASSRIIFAAATAPVDATFRRLSPCSRSRRPVASP